jgi:hypothetical protein
MRDKDGEERSNVEQPSLEGAQQSLSSSPCLNLREHNNLKNKVKTSTS